MTTRTFPGGFPPLSRFHDDDAWGTYQRRRDAASLRLRMVASVDFWAEDGTSWSDVHTLELDPPLPSGAVDVLLASFHGDSPWSADYHRSV